MNQEEFVKGIIKRSILLSLESYRKSFDDISVDSFKDPHWIEAKKLYGSFNEEEKEVFFRVLKQIHIDTIAGVLALLDGSYWVEGQTENLKLIHLDNNQTTLNGDLTTIFLNSIEDLEGNYNY